MVQRPQAVPVVFESENLTYQKMNARANQLAHYFRRYGIGPESRVGLCLDRSIEMIVAVLGILKASGVYQEPMSRSPGEIDRALRDWVQVAGGDCIPH
jgi:non-ribosomal peptide synthetase component F